MRRRKHLGRLRIEATGRSSSSARTRAIEVGSDEEEVREECDWSPPAEHQGGAQVLQRRLNAMLPAEWCIELSHGSDDDHPDLPAKLEEADRLPLADDASEVLGLSE
jgi:hypothetical protein